MNVLVLYNEPGEDASVEDRDVLDQRDAVIAALGETGVSATALGCTMDFDTLQRRLLDARPDIVFNLVESLGGTDRLMALAPMLLDAWNIPYTGASTLTMLTTSDKLAAKKQLRDAGLPTPDWCSAATNPADLSDVENGNWIVKAVWEHASFGMDDSAVIAVPDADTLHSELTAREHRTGKPHFAERFIAGREFNLSLLCGEVLPPAEIDFSSFPAGKPQIVGRQAKWDPESFEYEQTPRRFDFPSHDQALLDELAELSRACWRLFDLHGYARVDFRVDTARRPWILEVNVNPCLSPDAGFAAALAEAGIPYSAAMRRIVEDAGCLRLTRNRIADVSYSSNS